jgi:hypothetical protein
MDDHNTVTIELPPGLTLGDITSARGAIIEASTNYVDWEKLYMGDDATKAVAIGAPGKLLIAVAHQLGKVDA